MEVFRGSFVAASNVGFKASRKASFLEGSIVIVMWTEIEGLLSTAILCMDFGECVAIDSDQCHATWMTGIPRQAIYYQT